MTYYRQRAEGYRKQAVMREAERAERFVQIGMRAVIRDIQEYVANNRFPITGLIEADRLQAYLYALTITAGGYDDEPGDGEG